MSDELYRVVFTGRLVAGVSGKQALENLTHLFRKTPDEIRKVFSKPGTVIRSNLPLAKAQRMLAGLTGAGVVCEMQAMATAGDPVPATPSMRPNANTADGQILKLNPCATDLTVAPINCARLSGHTGGLETPRLDRSFIAYADILAASVYTPKESAIDLKLLLFTAGHKRPLLIEGMQITFSDFPDVPGENLPGSLRNFMRFLVAQNPVLCIDEGTAKFMRGTTAPLFREDPVLLSSMMQLALESSGKDLQRTPTTAPDPGTVTAPRPVQRLQPPSEPRGAESPEAGPAPVREIDVRSELDSWVDQWALPLCIALLAGFLLPLIKHSLLFDSVHLVWFWNLLGFGLDQQKLAAMATYSSGPWTGGYALLPLFSAVVVLVTVFAAPKRWRGLLLLAAGMVPLALAFTLMQSGGEVFGIIFLPVTVAGGGMMLALLFSALLVAAVNHLGKQMIVHMQLRILQGVAAMMLLLMTLLAFVAPDWNNIALYLLYIVWLAIALLAIKGAISGTTGQPLVSLLFRIALVWTPVAVVIAQQYYDSPFVSYVVEGGGGAIPLIIASLKAFLIYYGMAMAAGVGLVQLLGRRYAGR